MLNNRWSWVRCVRESKIIFSMRNLVWSWSCARCTIHTSHTTRTQFPDAECPIDVFIQLEIARKHRSRYVKCTFGPQTMPMMVWSFNTVSSRRCIRIPYDWETMRNSIRMIFPSFCVNETPQKAPLIWFFFPLWIDKVALEMFQFIELIAATLWSSAKRMWQSNQLWTTNSMYFFSDISLNDVAACVRAIKPKYSRPVYAQHSMTALFNVHCDLTSKERETMFDGNIRECASAALFTSVL